VLLGLAEHERERAPGLEHRVEGFELHAGEDRLAGHDGLRGLAALVEAQIHSTGVVFSAGPGVGAAPLAGVVLDLGARAEVDARALLEPSVEPVEQDLDEVDATLGLVEGVAVRPGVASLAE
jgi:cobalamin biosynthesis protein CbiD